MSEADGLRRRGRAPSCPGRVGTLRYRSACNLDYPVYLYYLPKPPYPAPPALTAPVEFHPVAMATLCYFERSFSLLEYEIVFCIAYRTLRKEHFLNFADFD